MSVKRFSHLFFMGEENHLLFRGKNKYKEWGLEGEEKGGSLTSLYVGGKLSLKNRD